MKQYFRYATYIFVLIAFNAARADPAVDFFRAIMIYNDRTVQALLKEGFDPNTPNPQGQVGLFLAMRDESVKVARALLAHPAIRIDATNAANETPLMIASLKGNIDAARELLSRGAAVNRSGWSPLHYAASGPSLPLLELLLQRGADINATSPNRTTPLMMAAGYGLQAGAEWLLGKGADARARNDKGLNAADFARTADRQELALRIEAVAR